MTYNTGMEQSNLGAHFRFQKMLLQPQQEAQYLAEIFQCFKFVDA